ncbi:MAG: ABC transporter ATP-binding protein/permease [Candidatus Cloacimonetes bacterium]|nr:ABC transporter ATP-binding protein/permease [Candidatus Cloacimonadota bacterium]
MKNIKWLLREWKKHPFYIVLLLSLTLISAAVTVIYPYVIKQLLDTIQNMLSDPAELTGITPELQKIIWVFIVIGLVRLLAATYPGFRALMNLTFEYTLRNRYFAYILRKDFKFFNKFRTGDLVTRLTSDITDWPKIAWFMCSGIFRAIESFSKIAFCVVAMLLLNWQLTLLTLIPLPLMIVIFYFTSNKLHRSFKHNQEAVSEINNQLEMSFSGIKIIKAFVCEEKYKRFFDRALTNRYNTEMRLVTLNTRLRMIYEFIDYFGQIAVIIFGGIMVVSHQITIGTFFAFYTYLAMIIFPILDLPQLFVSGKQAFVNIDRLEEIREFPEPEDPRVLKHRIEKVDSITFENVNFSYEKQELHILNNVSFHIKRGERVIIIGPVGSGKSTILGLLTGLLRPQSGVIKINDIPLDEIDLPAFRDKIGYVPQEPILFSGSIRENVHFGRESVSEEFYRSVLDIVQMDKEIMSFQERDETRVGQRGLTLSGGQKQRLAIARALIREPEILIFDDITASLDADNEESLWNDISARFGDITCFIVSHRLSTLRYVDNVIFLDSGYLIAKGEHRNIMQQYPEYSSFIQEHYQAK